MINLNDVRSKNCEWQISLTKLIGKGIADIEGYITDEQGQPTFKISELVLSDGTMMGVEGEHDFPYLCAYRTQPQPNFDDETFAELLRQAEEEDA